MLGIALAVLLYPGLAFTLALALAFARLAEGRARLDWIRGVAFWRSPDVLVSVASVLLAALALALLPWPYHPAAGWSWLGSPVAIWAALEGAFLRPRSARGRSGRSAASRLPEQKKDLTRPPLVWYALRARCAARRCWWR